MIGSLSIIITLILALKYYHIHTLFDRSKLVLSKYNPTVELPLSYRE